jgi:hypothetical protein
MKIVRFQAGHLEALELQAAQRDMARYLSREYGEKLEQAGVAFSAVKAGRILGCAGVETIWAGRGVAWSLLGCLTPVEFLGVHRRVCRFLEELDMRRIEMTVDTTHEAGHRWAIMLGFQHEGTLKAYTPDGRNCDLYARTK